jgi:hypothetical protein
MGEVKRKPRWSLRETAIAVSALFLLGPVTLGITQQAGYDDAARQKTAEYARYADQDVAEACRGVANVELVHCFSDARIKAELQKRDYEHEQADLVAQRTAALWTAIMGFAAVIGMGLSVLGVYLVWTTFRETKKANEIAMDERSPLIHVEAIDFDFFADTVRVAIRIKNFGTGEALCFSTIYTVGWGPYPLSDIPPDLSAPDPSNAKLPPGGGRTLNVSHPGLAAEQGSVMQGTRALFAGVAVQYEDRFGRKTSERSWFFCTGQKFAQKVMSDADKWMQRGDNENPGQPKFEGMA